MKWVLFAGTSKGGGYEVSASEYSLMVSLYGSDFRVGGIARV
jgi:hypothetical protein